MDLEGAAESHDLGESALPARSAATLDLAPEAIALASLLLSVSAGAVLFFRTSEMLTLVPVAGLMAGLGCRRWWSAASVAGLGVVGGTALASLISSPAWQPGLGWLPTALQAALLSAVLAALVAFALRASERLRPLLTALTLVAIIGAMWYSDVTMANIPTSTGVGAFAQPLSSAQQLSRVPGYSPSMSDDELFLIWVNRLRAGEPYYAMEASSFAEANAARPEQPIITGSPLSYRPPTLYVTLAQLPPGGMPLVLAMMAMCSVGVVAAFRLARRYVPAVAALAGAVVLAAMFTGYASMNLLDAESWSGICVLVSVAAFLAVAEDDRQRLLLNIVSAAFAVLAVALREIAAPLVVLGLAASLVDVRLREKRAWLVWAIALAVTLVGLAAHWWAAMRNVHAVAASHYAVAMWLSPDGAGLRGALTYAAVHAWLLPAAAFALAALGAIGSLVAPKSPASRIMLAGVVVGGLLLLVFVHPPGETNTGVAPGYWGDLLLPTVYACIPLVFALRLRQSRWRSASTSR